MQLSLSDHIRFQTLASPASVLKTPTSTSNQNLKIQFCNWPGCNKRQSSGFGIPLRSPEGGSLSRKTCRSLHHPWCTTEVPFLGWCWISSGTLCLWWRSTARVQRSRHHLTAPRSSYLCMWGRGEKERGKKEKGSVLNPWCGLGKGIDTIHWKLTERSILHNFA